MQPATVNVDAGQSVIPEMWVRNYHYSLYNPEKHQFSSISWQKTDIT
jgi:hypothetical protein